MVEAPVSESVSGTDEEDGAISYVSVVVAVIS